MKSRIGPFIQNGNLITDAIEKCELLKEQFDSVYSSPKYTKEENEQFVNENYERGELRDLDFSEEDFNNSMAELRPTSAPRPDGLHPKLLNKCRNALKTPMMIIWRKSMDEGHIPQNLKDGNINPSHKSGPKTMEKNYRPLTLTSICIKSFEKIVNKKTDGYLLEKALHNENQHCFRSGRSCLSQLLEHH